MADDASAHPDVLNSSAQMQLKSIVERVERLEVEKAEVAEQIKEVWAEAKGNGFDVKVLRKIVRIRKQDRAKRQSGALSEQREREPVDQAQRIQHELERQLGRRYRELACEGGRKIGVRHRFRDRAPVSILRCP